MEVWGATDVGMVRKQNQDYYRCSNFGLNQFLAVVCDGMGGAKSGDVASNLASDVFLEDVRQSIRPNMSQDEIVQMLVNAQKAANTAVFRQSKLSPEFSGMGTTLVAAFIQNTDAYIINVGDSRCYYSADGQIIQVTEDHSVVGLMVARGQITEEEARTHPNKNLITRAIGTEEEVMCDCFYLCMERGEKLVLCSDGLSNLVSREELHEALMREGGDSSFCNDMIELARKRGAPDNVTVVLLVC